MATKNISITEEAYRRLASLRQHNESFSEIINRLTRKKSLMRFAGIVSDKSAERIKKHVGKRRETLDKERSQRRRFILRDL